MSILSSCSGLSPESIERLDEARYASVLSDFQHTLDAAPDIPLDAVVHGVCVRLHTQRPQWQQFWSVNWFAPDQWATLTRGLPPAEPQIHLYAVYDEAGTAPWAGYSREHDTAFLKGDAPYGALRMLALGAVACKLAEEEAVHFVPGICVKRDGRGILLLSAPGPEPATLLATLLTRDDTHLVALDGVFIRYGLVRMVDGVTLLPTLVINEKGYTITGYRLFPWLEESGFLEPRADARCLTLERDEVYCFARDLDLGRAPEAFAFPLEQAWYVPTQIVTAQPGLAGALWPDPEAQLEGRSGLENVPRMTFDLLHRYGDWARRVAPSTGSFLQDAGQDAVVEALCRLRAARNGRTLVPPERLWPGRAGGHPCRPLQIERLELLQSEGPVLLDPETLPERLSDSGAYLYQMEGGEIAAVLGTLLRRAI